MFHDSLWWTGMSYSLELFDKLHIFDNSQSKILNIFLFFFMGVIIVIFGFSLFSTFMHTIDFLVSLIMLWVLIFCFFLNQKGYFTVASGLFISSLSVLICVTAVVNFLGLHPLYATTDVNMFVFLIFPVLISSILLAKKWTILFAISNGIGMILASLPFSMSTVMNVLIGPLLLFTTISLFSIITAYYRENLEKKKRAELTNKNKELNILNKELANAKCKLKTLNLHLEELVNQRTEKVERLIEQKNEFIHMLSHDLKNPLGIILNLLPVAEKRVGDDDVKKLIHIPYKQAENMKNLLSETITLASVDDTVENTSFEDIHLYDHIERLLDENHELFEYHDIKVDNQIDPRLVVNMDKISLHELVMNLLTNAVKYTPEDTKCLIHIDAALQDKKCVVSIRDNGCGINQDELDNIFDKFYRTGTPRKGLDSTGLGLSICKHIVKRYNGHIWAESPGPGKGSTFYFTLPNVTESKT